MQEALAEAETIARPKGETARLEKEVLVARARIYSGEGSRVAASVPEGAPPALQAVKLLAAFSTAPPASRGALLAAADALVEGAEAALTSPHPAPGALASAPLVQAMAATMYLAEGAFERALRAVRSGATLELLALAVQVYLRLDRPDLAEGAVNALRERDDESALYLLSAAHTCAALGGDRAKEAVLIYKDVLDRYGEGAGPAAMNGLVAAHVAARNYAAAEAVLEEAKAKDPSYADTLANAAAVAELQGRADAAARIAERLKRDAPAHASALTLAAAEAQFDRVAKSFAP